MEGSFSNPGYIHVDLIEEGRRKIFKWSEKRRTKRSGLQGTLYKITKLFITRSLVRSFIANLSIVVVFQMLLAGICTYACVKLGLEIDVNMALFVSPIVFPLAFSINANYQRRETVLEDLAMFKSASSVLFFCHRDWIKASELPVDLLKTLSNKLKFLVINIREFLLTEHSRKRRFILQAIYEDSSDIAQLNDKIRTSPMKSNSALVARIIHCHNLMCWSFERLRVIREYNSPRSLRAFTKVFIFLMPLLLSPYYVFSGRQTESTWAPYYISVLVSFLFGSLQAVQDKLDDPFDGIGEDDVNLGQLDDWTSQSLLTNRTVKVGRFTVTTTTAQDECSPCPSPDHTSNPLEVHENDEHGSPTKQRRFTLHPENSPKKLRRILSRKNERHAEARRPVVADLDENEFSTELEARCHGIASRLEGLSGTSIILPENRVPYVFSEYQGTERANLPFATPPEIDGDTSQVDGAAEAEKSKSKEPRFRLHHQLAVVKEEPCEPTIEIAPGTEKILLNMKSDAVVRAEDKKKTEKRPTVLGLFASPSAEQGNAHTEVSEIVFTTPEKREDHFPQNKNKTNEDFPLLAMNDPYGSTPDTFEQPQGGSSSLIHGEEPEPESNMETGDAPKLRFCFAGKRAARAKSDGLSLWARRKHKKKQPASKGKALNESQTELKATTSLSPLLQGETRSESPCSDDSDENSEFLERDEGTSAFVVGDSDITGCRNCEAEGSAKFGSQRSGDNRTEFEDNKPLDKSSKGIPEIVVDSPGEEESSLWDFDVSTEKASAVEKNSTETTKKNEDLLPSCGESSECVGEPSQNDPSSPEKATSTCDIPSLENVSTEPATSRFSVSANSEPVSLNPQNSKPNRSRFSVSST